MLRINPGDIRHIDEYDAPLVYSRAEFIEAVKNKTLGFPYKRYAYTWAMIMEKMEKLKSYNHKERIMKTSYFLRNVNPFGNRGFDYLGEPIVLASNESDYENFNLLSDIFQEKYRMKARVYTESSSPWDVFHNNPGLVYDKTIELYGTLTPRHVREGLWKCAREATSFRPTNLIAMVQMFGAKSVLDFCAGWGDRLLGALAAEVPYTGVDPNPKLHKGYRMMINKFAKNKSDYILIQDTAQNATIPSPGNKTNKGYDLIFTSPPYFDLEIYIPPGEEGEQLQSIHTAKTEDAWFTGFLTVALKKCWEKLNDGGHMIININQKNKYERYVSRMVDFIIKHCENASYLGVIGYSNERHTSNVQPMWVFHRGLRPLTPGRGLRPLHPREQGE
jgi:hypothetical protein